MQKNYKRMEHYEFLGYIDKLCCNLEKYIKDNEILIPDSFLNNKLKNVEDE